MPRLDLERRLGALFSIQAGHVARRQVLRAGGTDNHIRARRRSGQWEVPFPGVYWLAGCPEHPDGERWAAHLAVGEHSALGYEAAGELWNLDGIVADRMVLCVPHGGHPRVSGVRVHQPTDLEVDVVEVRGLRVTSPPRTLFDLASVTTHATLVKAVQGALVSRLVTPERLAIVSQRLIRPFKPGAQAFSHVLAEVFERGAPSESVLEDMVEAVALEAGIGDLRRQVRRPGGRTDFYSSTGALILEGDGRPWHARYEAMQRDRQRDFVHAQHGDLTVRLMWESLVHDRAQVVAGLRVIYEGRRRQRAA